MVERTETDFKFDFAVSYASPDVPFVSKVVESMKGRGLRVFFGPDEQADIVDNILIDYLTDVYLKKAKYCLVFISRHYVARPSPNHVERPAAESRSIGQSQRYIVPIRLDDSEIQGVTQAAAYFRTDSPKAVADLAISVLLKDQRPYVTEKDENTHHLVLRAVSLTEFDRDLLVDSFRYFTGTTAFQASGIPVQVHLPEFLTQALEANARIIESEKFRELDAATQETFCTAMKSIETTLKEDLPRVRSLQDSRLAGG